MVELPADGLCGSEAGGPGGLEVEAAGNGIYVKDFSCKVKVRMFFGLEGVRVNFLEADSAAGYELFLEFSFG